MLKPQVGWAVCRVKKSSGSPEGHAEQCEQPVRQRPHLRAGTPPRRPQLRHLRRPGVRQEPLRVDRRVAGRLVRREGQRLLQVRRGLGALRVAVGLGPGAEPAAAADLHRVRLLGVGGQPEEVARGLPDLACAGPGRRRGR